MADQKTDEEKWNDEMREWEETPAGKANRKRLEELMPAVDEYERWPTTGSEASFKKLTPEQMVEAGFDPDSCTMAEFEAFRWRCQVEGAAIVAGDRNPGEA